MNLISDENITLLQVYAWLWFSLLVVDFVVSLAIGLTVGFVVRLPSGHGSAIFYFYCWLD